MKKFLKIKFRRGKTQDIIPVEINSDNWENEIEDVRAKLRAIPNISKSSDLMRETLG